MDPHLKVALKGRSEGTQRTYRSTMSRCLEITKCKDAYTLLRGRLTTYNALVKAWPVTTTLKKALALLCTITRTNPTLVSKSLSDWWRERLDIAQKLVDKQTAHNMVSAKLKAKWLEYDTILAKVQALEADTMHKKPKDSQALVLLAMFAFLTPKRADLGAIRIVPSADKLDDSENGMVIPTKGAIKLILNTYKTAKSYGQFTEVMPDELSTIIRASLKAHPRSYLFSGCKDKAMSNSSYGLRVKDVMEKYMGHDLGVNDLRHLWITQNIQLAKVTHEQRGAFAESMMQSPEVQLEYIRVLESE